MLKIIHTADWHLGHQLHGQSREYEHHQFLDFLLKTLRKQQADVLLVAGDIFDTSNPSAAAQAQFYDFLSQARMQNPELDIIFIGGNHDSAARLDAPHPILDAFNIHIVGGFPQKDNQPDYSRLFIPLHDKQGDIKGWCIAMPFLRPADLPTQEDKETDRLIAGVKQRYQEAVDYATQYLQDGQCLIATGHCYMANSSISELSERRILGGNQHALPVDIFPDSLDYVALGHMHLAQRVAKQEHIRYSGSPIPLSLSEDRYHHQILSIEIDEQKQVNITPISIPRTVEIIRLPKKAEPLEEVLSQLADLKLEALPEEQQPWLELNIRLEQPQPDLRQKIEKALGDKPIRLIKITTSYTGKHESLADEVKEELEDLKPEDVFKRCWKRKHSEQIPDEYLQAFRELEGMVQG